MRRRSVEAVDVGQQDQQIGARHGGDACAQTIVVAVPDFVGGDGVVFVDHRHGAHVEQTPDGFARIEITAALLGVGKGDKNLARRNVTVAQHFRPCAGERNLPDSGGGLTVFQTQWPARQFQHRTAKRDGA